MNAVENFTNSLWWGRFVMEIKHSSIALSEKNSNSSFTAGIYTVSKKSGACILCLRTLVKSYHITILSLLHSLMDCRKSLNKISHLTSNLLLHYLVKIEFWTVRPVESGGEGKVFVGPVMFGGPIHCSKILKRVFQMASFWPEICI